MRAVAVRSVDGVLISESSTQPSSEDLIRQELARELHDSIAQTLSLQLIKLEAFKAEQQDRLDVLQMVAMVQSSTRNALDDVRRVLYQLRGTGNQMDARTAIVGLAKSTTAATIGLTVRTAISRQWPRLVPAHIGIQLFGMIEEALTNAVRHSRASRVTISISPRDEGFEITIIDNGRGIATPDGTIRAGLGLTGLHERATLVGASVRMASRASRGTQVRILVPCPSLGLPAQP